MSDLLKIDLVGAGRVGGGLGERWTRAGHDVRVVGREDAVRPDADVVLLAVPAMVVAEIAGARAAELAGRVVVDATNDVPGTLGCVARAVADAAPGARVVKAFNTVFAALYDEVDAHPGVAEVALCGDDEDARAVVARLATDAGFRPFDAGPLDAAADLEGFARMVIRAAYSGGHGPFVYRFGSPADLAGTT